MRFIQYVMLNFSFQFRFRFFCKVQQYKITPHLQFIANIINIITSMIHLQSLRKAQFLFTKICFDKTVLNNVQKNSQFDENILSQSKNKIFKPLISKETVQRSFFYHFQNRIALNTFYFSTVQKQKLNQSVIEQHFRIIDLPNLLWNPPLLYDQVCSITQQYENAQDKVQILQKVVDILRQKDVWKNHPQVNLLLLTFMTKCNQINQQEQYIFELKQISKTLQGKTQAATILSQIYFTIGRYFCFKKAKDFSKASYYLEKAYKFQTEFKAKVAFLLINSRLKQEKYQELKEPLQFYIKRMSQSEQIDPLAGDIFRTKLKLFKNLRKQQKYQQAVQTLMDLTDEFNKYFQKWGKQIINLISTTIDQNLPPEIKKKINQSQNKKQTTEQTIKAPQTQSQLFLQKIVPDNTLFQFPSLSIQIDRQIAEMLFSNNLFDQAIKHLMKYQMDSNIVSATLGQIFQILSMCYKNKNQPQKALKTAQKAKHMYFSAPPSSVNYQWVYTLFNQIIELVQDKDETFLSIIKVDQWLNKIHEFSMDNDSFIQQLKIRHAICQDYCKYGMITKFQIQINRILKRLQQFKGNISLSTFTYCSAMTNLLRQQFQKQISDNVNAFIQIRKGEKVVKKYFESNEYQSLSQDQRNKMQKRFQFFFRRFAVENTLLYLTLTINQKNINKAQFEGQKIQRSIQKAFKNFQIALSYSNENNQFIQPQKLFLDVFLITQELLEQNVLWLTKQYSVQQKKKRLELAQKGLKKINQIKKAYSQVFEQVQDLMLASIDFKYQKLLLFEQIERQASYTSQYKQLSQVYLRKKQNLIKKARNHLQKLQKLKLSDQNKKSSIDLFIADMKSFIQSLQ